MPSRPEDQDQSGYPVINALYPAAALGLTDAALLAELDHSCLRVNFVSSIDGAVTRDGKSGGLSGSADKRLFGLLRRVADVVLVAAGTVRHEGYEAMRVDEESVRWRIAHGKTAHPVFAIVSGRLDLDPTSEIFTDAPEQPIVFTTRVGAARAPLFAGIAEIVVIDEPSGPGGSSGAGATGVDGARIAEALRERGLNHILCEGGPTFLGELIAANAVDELCLTIEPTLEAGEAGRIAAGEAAPRRMRLARVLQSDQTLLLRYSAALPGSAADSPA